MRFTVVIPVLNRAADVGPCIEAVSRSARGGSEVEVIVADGGSGDGTAEAARRAGARVVVRGAAGPLRIAALRNAGAREAGGDILAFLDVDMRVPEDWLAAAARHYEGGFRGGLAFVMTVPPEAGWVGRVWNTRGAAKETRRASYLPSSNLFVPRSVFESLGGFDEALVTAEDKDLTIRMKEAGCPLLLSGETRAMHLGYERGLREFVSKEFWRQSSALVLAWKHGYSWRSVRHLALSSAHLAAAAAVVVASAAQSPVAVAAAAAAWLAPSAILAAREDLSGWAPLFLLVWLRWNVAGVALAHQVAKRLGVQLRGGSRHGG
jgi:glycosyltransferase involved in cell wall biosynthesis